MSTKTETEEVLKKLENMIEKTRKAREMLATKQKARKKILFSNKRIPPDQEWKLMKLKKLTEDGDKKLKLYKEFFDKIQRWAQEQPRECQTSQDDTSSKTNEAADNLQRKRTNEVVAASDADAGVEFVEKVTPKKTKASEAMQVEVLKKEMPEELQEEKFEHLLCKFCRSVPGKKERYFTTAAALKAHVEGEHEGRLGRKLTRQCPVCPYSARVPSQVTEHIRSKHSKEKLFKCSCGKKFMTFPAYSAHQKKYGHGN